MLPPSSASADSVILPPAKPGVILQVANNGANSMTVYAQGSDTINGVAAATGVSQMAGSTVTYTCLKAGTWTAQGIGAGAAGQFPTYSTQTGITAQHTAPSQATGVPITASQAQITVCATAGDAVTMPPAKAGMEITLVNNGAASASVYPASAAQGGVSGETVSVLVRRTRPIPLVITVPIIFYCFVTGTWTINRCPTISSPPARTSSPRIRLAATTASCSPSTRRRLTRHPACQGNEADPRQRALGRDSCKNL